MLKMERSMESSYTIANFGFIFLLMTSFLCGYADAKISFMKPSSNLASNNFEKMVVKSDAFEVFQTPNTVASLAAESPYIPVINLLEAEDLGNGFNICDESTYPTSNLSFNMTIKLPNGEIISTTRWVALFQNVNADKLGEPGDLCSKVGAPKYMLFAKYIAKHAQQLGASAMISYYKSGGSARPIALASKINPPNVDSVKRTVEGTEITIPAILLEATEENYSALFDPKVGQVWVQTSSLADTDENLMEGISEPFSAYIVVGWIFSFWNCYLLYIVIKGIYDEYVATREKRSTASKQVATMRYLILVPELFKCCAGIIFGIDPKNMLNVYGYNYVMSSFLATFISSMGNFSDIAACFYCYEIYCVFRSAALMKRNTSVFEKNPWIAVCIIAGASLSVVVRMFQLWAYYYVEGNTNLVWVVVSIYLYSLLVYTLSVVYLNCLSFKTIKLINAAGEGKSGSAVSGTTGNILTMSGFMRKTSIGLLLYYVFFYLTGSGIGNQGATQQTVMFCARFFGSAIASTYKIKAAIFMIGDGKKKAMGTVVKMTVESNMITVENNLATVGVQSSSGLRSTIAARKV